jgi:hypothetical protein
MTHTLNVCLPAGTLVNLVATGIILLAAKPSTPSQAAGCLPAAEFGMGWWTTGSCESKATATVKGLPCPCALFEGESRAVTVIFPDPPIALKVKKSYSLTDYCQLRELVTPTYHTQCWASPGIKRLIAARPGRDSGQSPSKAGEVFPRDTVHGRISCSMSCLHRNNPITFNETYHRQLRLRFPNIEKVKL